MVEIHSQYIKILANQSLIQSNTATDLYIAFDGSTYITDQNGSNQSMLYLMELVLRNFIIIMIRN